MTNDATPTPATPATPAAPIVPPEMSRPVAIGRIGLGLDFTVMATPDECVALAKRMTIPTLARLVCRFSLTPAPQRRIRALGRLEIDVTQICVVSLDPFSSTIVEDFVVNFVPAGRETPELDFDAEDEIPFTGDILDLGEAAAEQLGLALDPFPRKPGAELPPDANDGPENAFAALLGRK